MTPATSAVRVLCTVRGCGEELARGPRAWRCPRGHSFDVAREGYVNLLQPGDRRSRAAGDSRAAVSARWRLEERGVGVELAAAIEERVRALAPRAGAPALDVGAGTGLVLERLAASCGLDGWALELSAAAAELGARRRPGLSWVVANADRALPFADATFPLVVSCAGPKNPAEMRRVLAPGGALLVAVPAPDDLIELRAILAGEGRRTDRAERALTHFGEHFACADRALVTTRRWLRRDEIDDVLATTYRGARRSERERLGDLEALEMTFAAEILHLVPR